MTPLNTFFFGGEKTFTTPSGETNYFARSNRWPQQTTVLGMLRYLIGKQCNFDPLKIGDHSFIYDSKDGFGIIEKLSPVFIISKDKTDKDIYLLEAGIDHQKHKETSKIERTQLKPELPSEKSKFGVYFTEYKGNQNIPNLNFDYKEFLIPALFNSACTKELFDPSELFHEQFQVGNKKNYKGSTDDEAFFKQVFYRLEKNCAFAVILETNELLPFDVVIDTMGADQSIYRIEAMPLEKIDSVFEEIEKGNNSITDANRIVLLSDAYVKSENLNKCTFSICDTTDFRNIITHSVSNEAGIATQYFHGMNSLGSAQKTKVKYNLLRRGSVLFTETPKDLLQDLKNDIFHKIGYNYFQLTN